MIKEKYKLLVVGTDHNFLDLEDREPFHLIGKKYTALGNLLSQISTIKDFMILNTCNRIEVMAIVKANSSSEKVVIKFLDFDKLKNTQFYIKREFEAFKHSALVTAGLFSQTPGENHIVAQVKEAFGICFEKRWSQNLLQRWLNATLHTSKNIRNSIAPILKNYEIEQLACDFLKAKITKRNVAIVIGTGEIGNEIILHLRKLNVQEIRWVYHSHIPEKVSNEKIFRLADLPKILNDADLIISAVTSAVPILHTGHAPFFSQEKEIEIIDLAMPRNVSRDLIKVMENITLTDLDDLKFWFRREGCDMNKVFEIANEEITKNLNYYEKIIK